MKLNELIFGAGVILTLLERAWPLFEKMWAWYKKEFKKKKNVRNNIRIRTGNS